MVLLDCREVRQRIPDSRRLRALRDRFAGDGGVVGTVRLRALEDVVAPAHVMLMQEIRQVGPGIVRNRVLDVPAEVRWFRRMIAGVDAARRIVPDRARRRPFADREQVRGQAPRRVRLEHAVLQDEVPRVSPVVRDLVVVVVAHHVDAVAGAEAVRVVAVEAAERASHGGTDEAVHRAAVDVADRVEPGVRAAEVAVARVVERPDATAARVGHAHVSWDAVRARIRAEIGVERTVLLHDHDDVLDLVDALRNGCAARHDGRRRSRGEPARSRTYRKCERRSDEHGPLHRPEPTPPRVTRQLTCC